MSSEIFVDSQCFIALANPRDSWRSATLEAMRTLEGDFITTQYVLLEVGDALSKRGEREGFIALITSIEKNQQFLVIPSSHVLFHQAVELWTNRPDKDWSLTDCSSFVVMNHRQIQKALTADHHFTQAGFEILIKPPSSK